ncbi:Glutathione S-transferase family protein [Vibrio crassostreae]|uniref:Glutathione S-transferase family protein n=1 Tax=Vibrio crassostreae TaxID=246167 RepID=A0A822MVT0_9VIBR|nr:glutathione S-transferase N-terminal domain-containing protein [Vibrio crassostreae]MDH5951540.1 glutathione S-transferase N-terminal domain-containing protein [Vibrio crassostreae]TCN09413.1 glutathione S-transferase [Vibrio crassostreae]TCU10248.1 glutathione S-transferase [Vibrio crassostreae]CAK1982103.1 Glutathione S-transferase family protein [Vibrio crassostreae]CAK2086766.1 Glutathione S-transferase family protein [Vibrio crassostreae]
MQLYLNETSPFSRVVAATALLSRCSPLSFVWVDPWSSPVNLKSVNPFCLIPALELDDGTALTESLCICQYLIETYQPQTLRQVMLNSANDMHTLGTAKTLMEIAFRTVALTRYADSDNALIQRGQEGIVAALERLDQEIKEQGLESLLSNNLATLYIHVALDYVQFRHTELFDEVNSCTIIDFLHLSPFAHVLTHLSIESLANKPDYETSLDSFGRDT